MPTLRVGIDEAGRGCVLGPLVVGIVAAMDADRRRFCDWNVRDSKRVPPKERDLLAARIKERCWFELRIAHAPEVDVAVRDRSRTLNGLELEMMAALLRTFRENHPTHDTFAVIDAPSINAVAFREKLHAASAWEGPGRLDARHHADDTDRTVAAASIIAKHERERLLALIKQETGIDFGSGYSHDPRTISHLATLSPDIAYVRWSWATAGRVREKVNIS